MAGWHGLTSSTSATGWRRDCRHAGMEAGGTVQRLLSPREERAAAGTWMVTAEAEGKGPMWQVGPTGCAFRLQMGGKD